MKSICTGLLYRLRRGLPSQVGVAAWTLSTGLLCLPVLAQPAESVPSSQAEQRRIDLRSTVRQNSLVVNPRHLNAQERAELRKQLARDLRAQAALTSVR